MNTQTYAIGDFMRIVELPRARIAYLLETRNIQPCGKVGNTFLYNAEALERLQSAVNDMRNRRSATLASAAAAG